MVLFIMLELIIIHYRKIFVHNFVNIIKNIEYLDIDDNNVLFINDDIIINLKTERINND